MVAIKDWYLNKMGMLHIKGWGLDIVKETEKACLISHKFDENSEITWWVPKSVIIDKWEVEKKNVSNFAYHNYLVDIYCKAYDENKIENYIWSNGYNKYNGKSFIHKETTKKIKEILDKNNVDYMNKTEWVKDSLR